MLPSFVLQQRLGQGGQAICYLAQILGPSENSSLPHQLALKVFNMDLIKKDKAAMMGIHVEEAIHSRVNHSNIVKMHFGVTEGKMVTEEGEEEILFLGLEYVDGGELFDLVKNCG